MLGRLMLILVQAVVGWYASMELVQVMPSLGSLDIFLLAGIFALMVWAIAVLAAVVLKDLETPGPTAFLFSFATAVLFASLAILPDVQSAVSSVVGTIDVRIYPLVGAVIGSAIQS